MIWRKKNNNKQWYNFRSCKFMQLEIDDLTTKFIFVYCLQRVVHYLFHVIRNKLTSKLF